MEEMTGQSDSFMEGYKKGLQEADSFRFLKGLIRQMEDDKSELKIYFFPGEKDPWVMRVEDGFIIEAQTLELAAQKTLYEMNNDAS